MSKYFSRTVKIAKKIGFRKYIRQMSGKKTPFLIINTEKVKENFQLLRKMLPQAGIFYAVKANPHPAVIRELVRAGVSFDVASRNEMDLVLNFGVPPDRISFGNTIKKDSDIRYFFRKGGRLLATDSISDLKKISRMAPGAKVFFRLQVDGEGADWPLSRKFGAHPDIIFDLAKTAVRLGLVPQGLSFHVGSQQRDVEQWDSAIAQCKYLFERLEREGVRLRMINLGGGLPSDYLIESRGIEYYTKKIKDSLKFHFGSKIPEIIIEPGRYMVANAGVLVSEVVMIAKKAKSMPYEWMYIDCGIWNGLDECAGEALKYPIFAEGKTSRLREFVLAGPTCDSHDILYENFRYELPSSIKEGDRVYFLTAGAYTYQVSSVGFNGFEPLRVYVIKNSR